MPQNPLFTPTGVGPVPLVRAAESESNEPTMRAGRQKAYDAATPKPPASAYVKHGANGNSVHSQSSAIAPHDKGR